MAYKLSHSDQSIIREALDAYGEVVRLSLKCGAMPAEDAINKTLDIVNARKSLNTYVKT